MSRYCIGIVCHIGAAAVAAVAAAGLIPVAILLNPWRRVEGLAQTEEIFFSTSLLKSAGIAVVGLVAGYILLRLGSHLKSKRGSGK